jgi:enolase
MKIKNIFFRKIFDTRGNPTLEVEIENKKGITFLSCIPSGKSKSSKEAIVLNFNQIQSKNYLKKLEILKEKEFKSIKDFDNFLIKLDGTKNKSRLGGNVILGLSLAFGRALSFEKRKTFFELLEEEFFKENKNKKWSPVIFSNFINGGEHSYNNLDIQEYLLLLPLQNNPALKIESLIKLYKETGQYLEKKAKSKALPLGDENGYAINFKNNLEPLLVLEKLIKKNNLSDFKLGIDVAANSIYKNKEYIFEGKKNKKEDLEKTYLKYFKKISILESIEDPFYENDALSFKLLKEKMPSYKIIIGDDLISTQKENLYKFKESINGVIIKPNQVGTITETMETCLLAKKLNIKTIFSHRSGETEDPFIIELAYAARSFGIKIGAPLKDRISKFNQLLRLIG